MLAAVQGGDTKKLAELIKQDPGFKVNLILDEDQKTLLHHACEDSIRSAVIPLLLAHPDINVNLRCESGYTPFTAACYFGSTSCVRELLQDSRVNVNVADRYGITPLCDAASTGFLDIITWWIASGREMDLGKPGDVDRTDAIGGAKKKEFQEDEAKEKRKTEVVTLLERFKSDATKTRSEVRLELGIDGQSNLL